MAFANQGLMAQLWEAEGLHYLLLEKPVAKELALLAPLYYERERRQSFAAPRVPHEIASPPRQPRQLRQPSPPKEPAPKPRQEPRPVQERSTYPVSEWPLAWQQLLHKVQPGKVVWCYPELGCDLLGIDSEGRAARRLFFRRVFASKPPLPQGTNTFWPAFLPTQGEREAAVERDLFWAGVRFLGARLVLLFGEQLNGALLGNVAPFSYTHYSGKNILVLPKIGAFCEDEKNFALLLNYFRAGLARYIPVYMQAPSA